MNKKTESMLILKTVENDIEVFFYNDEEKADCLYKYFASFTTVDESSASLPQFTLKCNSEMNEVLISTTDVEGIIHSLDINKAVGLDQISHRLLKGTKHTISKPLWMLFNKSLYHKKFPLKCKESVLYPLFKKGDKSLVSPISLMSCVGKVMERCVYKHLYNYLYFNGLLYVKQSGFLRGHSTVHQLLDLYHHIVSSLDHKQNLCMDGVL